LLYLGDGKIDDTELPHRMKITQMVLDEYRRECNRAKDDIKNALGRISMTTDLWSDLNRDSYMAVTAHFMTR
ncbi:uncharacterized protein EDB91DRAFT_1001002, partial [Suillus paluster]|uniref:uncharacterized protein n=1 Tax=Suillus paluster TaxID=48578 RepID=UPI001B861DEF